MIGGGDGKFFSHFSMKTYVFGYSLEVSRSLFLHENVYCGYSLEGPRRGPSNEYPQHTCMFSWRNKKSMNTFWLKKKKKSPILSYEVIMLL